MTRHGTSGYRPVVTSVSELAASRLISSQSLRSTLENRVGIERLPAPTNDRLPLSRGVNDAGHPLIITATHPEQPHV
jgi:hypothetical protein